ncbi:ATP-binding protein [Candidatus Bipolaricaulota bacterium]|nr:ATP-binding protein [Candidatus Bipolaricaulota bacterium]
MEPWYKVVTPRKEVREGRSFNPDEFAIHLEQVVAGRAPADYQDPHQFFDRTCFTRALTDHIGMVLRRLAGKTENTAPVMTLVTQFGGGKTHTLTALYHLAVAGPGAAGFPGVGDLLRRAGIEEVPQARVAVFVGNAWDPREGRETPWIDLARQLAGDRGVALLGKAAHSTPPGTEALGEVFTAAEGPVLVLLDEVLNFLNRHRPLAEPFHAFLQNLTGAITGTTHGVAMISLPRSQVEMTDWDHTWQERITKVVKRVAKDLIANDEAEIAEVVRRRLFEDLGGERTRANVARAYAEWCFERRAQLPPEWTAADTAVSEKKARERLQERFEACYPFHPATLSVFQRKWQALPQYQQTRGTLAMLAQWVARAYREGFTRARPEPLLTLGSAPLDDPGFRSTVLGQIGEARLMTAIEVDIAGEHAHARVLDADTKGPLKDIHRRVGTAIFFESSGGQVDRLAHLPELRFALGGPGLDTTSVDTAAATLESKAFFVQRVGSDGYRVYHKAKIDKAVSDRRASLDEESEVKPAMRKLVEAEFRRGATVSVCPLVREGADVPDTPKLTLVVLDPELEWTDSAALREQIADWTRQRGGAPRLYPASLVWCLKKPGRDLREKVELWLAWRRVEQEVANGTLGADLERAERAEVQVKVKLAEEAARDEVWAGYRYVVIADAREAGGLKTLDLGAGHASGAESLSGRVLAALRSEGRLSESVGASYIERNWPPALKESGEWPLASLRQSFLNGSLTRLVDPDALLRQKVAEFVARGEFGLAAGRNPDGTFARVWFEEMLPPDEVAFDSDVFLLLRTRAEDLKRPRPTPPQEHVLGPPDETGRPSAPTEVPDTGTTPPSGPRTLRLRGSVPPEVWNRLGTRILPKLRAGSDLQVGIEMSVTVRSEEVENVISDLRQILADLGLSDQIEIGTQ